MKPIISVRNLSKKYIIGKNIHGRGARTFRDIFDYKTKRLFRRDVKRSKEDTTLWALKDVSFDVDQGEVVGIIGRNGAGKSTLLKILSRITEPTEGNVTLRGRVASLLEVGTGFSQELTGRENIFLNGSILGMKKSEIKNKFDEIVSFAEIEKFIDTPVKRYSSGMYVRLAFAVAAHLEPEILIVDEVLAVGDAEFQKKCLGKMGEASKEGRTVLFVSHNMDAIRNLCATTMLIENGQIGASGRTSQIVDSYLSSVYHRDKALNQIEYADKPVDAQFKQIRIFNSHGIPCQRFNTSEEVHFEIVYELRSKQYNLSVIILILSMNGTRLFAIEDVEYNPDLLLGRKAGSYKMTFSIPPNILNEGEFSFVGDMHPVLRNSVDMVDGFSFEVYSDKITPLAYSKRAYKGCIDLNIKAETMSFDSNKQV